MNELEKPMGNTELRLNLADLKSELAEVKSIGIDTHTQATKTNGRVKWLEKMIWLSIGALPLLTIWATWLTKETLDARNRVPATEIQAAVERGIENRLQLKN